MLLEEIEGDLSELYERRIQKKGKFFANRRFAWDVLRFFRWSNIKRSKTNKIMDNSILFRSYLKVGFRNIRKYWVASAINIFGLALAISLSVTIFLFVDMQLHMDNFHTKADRIHQVTNYVIEENEESIWSDTPMQLGPQLKSDHPSVADFARMEFANANVRQGDNVFSEFIVYTDPSYFQIFDFEMIYGNRDVLIDKNNVVISYDMAIKYFNNEDPIGKELSFKFNNGETKRFIVGAVLEKYPYNASWTFDFFLPIAVFFDQRPDKNNSWDYLCDATFIEMEEGAGIQSIKPSFDEYVKLQNTSGSEWTVGSFVTFELPIVSRHNYEIVSSIAMGGHPAGRIAMSVICLFILILASFNYMNISIATASKRLREIGLRKVMGGIKRQIVTQFMVENAIQCTLALLLGSLMSYYLILPLFNLMLPILIPFEFSSFQMMIGFFGGLLILVGVISGAYPSLYISRFQPVHIFRGNQKFGGKNLFSKILLGFQFFFAFITIVGTFVFTDNAMYLRDKKWGYNPQNILSVEVQNTAQSEVLKAKIEESPDVSAVSISRGHVAQYNQHVNYKVAGEEYQGIVYHVDGEYLDIVGIPLVEGRYLNDQISDQRASAVVNQAFIRKMGWNEGIGQTFNYDSSRYTIVGVVHDFHYTSFYNKVEAVFFVGLDDRKVNYLTVKSTNEDIISVDDIVLQAWREVAPDDPYERIFQEDVFNDFYEENTANITLMLLIAGITIILATLGLYGLFAFNVQRRIKEFSVRKVLGAKPLNIIKIASKQYVWVITISFILGAPLGYFSIFQLVNTIYPDPKAAGPLPFILAISIVTITIAVTIAGQIMKATKLNPAENLRNE